MINFLKSQPAPECLALEKGKKSGDYKCGDVLTRLKADFFNKCYICESKAPPTINVEHFVPHKENVELKFSWDNLFWSCGHCNNAKLARFTNLLDCTKPESSVETRLRLKMNPFPKEKIEIVACDSDPRTTETKELLDAVYNGTTHLKTIEAANIRDEVLKEVKKFQDLLIYYFDIEPYHDKNELLEKIKGHLSDSSSFTAIKRWIIRDSAGMFEELGEYVETKIGEGEQEKA